MNGPASRHPPWNHRLGYLRQTACSDPFFLNTIRTAEYRSGTQMALTNSCPDGKVQMLGVFVRIIRLRWACLCVAPHNIKVPYTSQPLTGPSTRICHLGTPSILSGWRLGKAKIPSPKCSDGLHLYSGVLGYLYEWNTGMPAICANLFGVKVCAPVWELYRHRHGNNGQKVLWALNVRHP